MPDIRIVFKHSPTCDLSARALVEMDRFRAEHPGAPVEQLDVFADRPACLAIEAETGVRHESPQVLVFVGSQVAWHASHRRVTAQAVAEALAAARAAALAAARAAARAGAATTG
ncbi:MAG: monothiol bacilliredoxin BrxC family protein [Gemmatimonadota bacterium]|jgi:bacillithiol system protein YtxJ|nr:thioredoxin family protein [Gemmatimonadota bacterium]